MNAQDGEHVAAVVVDTGIGPVFPFLDFKVKCTVSILHPLQECAGSFPAPKV
jgi:hypothetical protein